MGRVERVGHVGADPDHLVQLERSPRDPRAQGLPFHELHRDEVVTVRLLHLVDRDDVGVVQRGRELRLADEPLGRGTRFEGGAGEELERHVPVEPFITGAIDDAHAARADALRDAVA